MATLRVASLLPSATDTLFSLGLIDHLVGCSHECDADGIRNAIVCTESKYSFEQGLDSEQIHLASSTSQTLLWEASFRTPRDPVLIVEWMLSPYHTLSSALSTANPDVILTQIQTSNSDLQLQDIENALHEFLEHPVKVIHLDPQCLNDSLNDILLVAEACGNRTKGEDLVIQLQNQFSIAQNMCSGREKCRAICLQWIHPLFSAGAWVSDLIQLAGGTDVSFRPSSEPSNPSAQSNASHPISWESIEQSSANLLVFLLCGCTLKKSMQQVQELMAMEELKRMVKKGVRIFVADGVRLFSRPGPSLVDSLQVLTEIFHPECQPFGHENKLWVQMA